MGSFSIWHWLIVLVIVLLVFGTKKLRNLGSDLGGAVKGFKDGIRDGAARCRELDPRQRARHRARTGRRGAVDLVGRRRARAAGARRLSRVPQPEEELAPEARHHAAVVQVAQWRAYQGALGRRTRGALP